MTFRASLSVLLGCQFGQANKLLAAAERGVPQEVEEVLLHKPQLAAFSGFHGSTSPLHRAAAGGHVDVCRAIVEAVKRRAEQAEQAQQEVGLAGGLGKRVLVGGSARRWRSLLRTVLNQRTHKSKTPLMLACEKGHAAVVAYLLAQGADPLLTDMFSLRTALHYAAAGGHAACVRVLCSDATRVEVDGVMRPAREVVMPDLQVGSARFIDQRSFGGLTALHFAAVSASLEAVQALLRVGAAAMVKTDGEAFIGNEHLPPGSTPLHIAVIMGSVPTVHALLQAHAELMTIAGVAPDPRGRRPWEGHSRTDIRSLRNSNRRLPYHLARERNWTQLMQLVDPRVPIDNALDAARDTEHGIGPKRLSTLCSMALQAALLHWLDAAQQRKVEEELRKAAHQAQQQLQQRSPGVSAVITMIASPSRPMRRNWSRGRLGGSTASSPAAAAATLELAAAEQDSSSHPHQGGGGSWREWAGVGGAMVSPFAGAGELGRDHEEEDRSEDGDLRDDANVHSAPATPRVSSVGAPADSLLRVPSTAPAVTPLSLSQQNSLHAYMGMLSTRRSPSARTGSLAAAASGELPTTANAAAQAGHRRQPSLARQSAARRAASSGADAAGASAPTPSAPGHLRSSFARMHSLAQPLHAAPKPLPAAQAGGMRRALITLRGRLSSGDGSRAQHAASGSLAAAPAEGQDAAAPTPTSTAPAAAADSHCVSVSVDGSGGSSHALDATCRSGKCSLDGASAAGDAVGKEEEEQEEEAAHADGDGDGSSCTEEPECGVCLDHSVEVAFAGCEHQLCLECARSLTTQEKKPPTCPFCRRMVVGFVHVPAGSTGALALKLAGC